MPEPRAVFMVRLVSGEVERCFVPLGSDAQSLVQRWVQFGYQFLESEDGESVLLCIPWPMVEELIFEAPVS